MNKKFLFIFIFLVFLILIPFIYAEMPHGTPVGYVTYGDTLEMWNEEGTYYFNKTSGIQWTQDPDDYWTKNILCIGYYSGGTWNKIKCADELGEFNRFIDTNNTDYVNATLWKDFTYAGYDMRLGLRGLLESGDNFLTVIPFAKNIDTEDIPFELGFAWKITDVDLPDTDANSIFINDTYYQTDDVLDETFINMSQKYGNQSDVLLPRYKVFGNNSFIKLDWSGGLDYKVVMQSDGTEESFNISLRVNASFFLAGQEKSMKIYWQDPEGDYTGTSWDTSSTSTKPYSITTDNEFIWIADFTDGKVYKFYMNGTYANDSWTYSGKGANAFGMGNYGDYLYIAHRVGTELTRWWKNGTFGNFSFDTGSEIPSSGGVYADGTNFYLTDAGTGNIAKYLWNGTYSGTSWAKDGGCTNLAGMTGYHENLTYTCYGPQEGFKEDKTGALENFWNWDALNAAAYSVATNGSWYWVTDDTDNKVYIYEAVVPVPVDATFPNVTINDPTNTTFETTIINFNVTAVDDTAVTDCNYSLDFGVTNVSMSNPSGDSWNATNTSMTIGSHTATYYCQDASDNINGTENVTLFIVSNVSLVHIDISLDEVIFNTANYITIANITFVLSQSEHLTVKGVGQLRKFSGGSSSEVSMRLRVNGNILFDEPVRTVSGISDIGVFNIPINDTEGFAGTNNLTIEIKEDGAGAVNLSSLEVHVDTDMTNFMGETSHLHDTFSGSFSSTSFMNLANFTFNKTSFNSSSLVDVVHTFGTPNSNTVPSCYLENNETSERTPTYSRWLETSGDTGSSGISYRSTLEMNGTETWQLWCSSSDTDTVNNNVTVYIMDMVDELGNEIRGFQNQTIETQSISGDNNVIASFDSYTIQNGTQLEITGTIIIQSTSGKQDGDSSPLIFINSPTVSEANCSQSYQRSLSSNSDIGTIKIYLNCENISQGETHNFTIYTNVTAGENLDILNTSFNSYEGDILNTSAIAITPIIIIDNPVEGGNISGNADIDAIIADFATEGWTSNISLMNTDGTFNLTILNETDNQNTTGTIFNTSLAPEGDYVIQWNVTNSVGTNFDEVNITIDNTNPTFDNLRNFTHPGNTSFSQSITASDDSGIDIYFLNDTSIFDIDNNGLITNVTNLSRVEIQFLNISANDTAGNLISGIFFINITELIIPTSQCNETFTLLTTATSNNKPYGRLCHWLDFR